MRARDVHCDPCRARTEHDQPHPRVRDGRPAVGEERPPGHGDGARPARPRALQPGHAPRPRQPAWPDRDRFVLSNGHASILQYSLLYLSGYGLELDDIKAFRQWESRTPGHPEAAPHRRRRGHDRTARPGLRQRRRHGDRRAAPARPLRRRRHRPPHLRDRRRRLLHGGHQPRGRLARRPPRPRPADLRLRRQPHHHRRRHRRWPTATTSRKRFEAYGWHVDQPRRDRPTTSTRSRPPLRDAMAVDGPAEPAHRCAATSAAPSPESHRQPEAHGNPFTAEEVTRTKEVHGLPRRAVLGARRSRRRLPRTRGRSARRASARGALGEAASPPAALDRAVWDACWARPGLAGWDAELPAFEHGEKLATRSASSKALDATLDGVPGLMAGAADLTGNTGTKLDGSRTQSRRASRTAARSTSASASTAWARRWSAWPRHGGVLPVGGTFFVFSDYMRPAVRLAALSAAPRCVFVFTHDSVGVGEDGPTHQPDRAPRLAAGDARPAGDPPRRRQRDRRRRGGPRSSTTGPTALVLSRQAIPVVHRRLGRRARRAASCVDADRSTARAGRHGQRGRACASTPPPRLAERGHRASGRVDAVVGPLRTPSRRSYRDDGASRRASRPSVEAATTFGWERWADAIVGIDRFGASAPGRWPSTSSGINVDQRRGRGQRARSPRREPDMDTSRSGSTRSSARAPGSTT